MSRKKYEITDDKGEVWVPTRDLRFVIRTLERMKIIRKLFPHYERLVEFLYEFDPSGDRLGCAFDVMGDLSGLFHSQVIAQKAMCRMR